MSRPVERLSHFGFSLYWLERRVEIVGPRLRKPYRNSRAAAEMVRAREVSDAMRAAVKRLERIL